MPQFTYAFSDPTNSNFTVTTEDTPQNYTIAGNQYTGYAVTGISGTFNGQNVTSLIGPGGAERFDDDSNGGGVGGYYDNTIFLDSSQGYGGSFYGIDGDGLGLRAGPADSPTDYTIYTSGGQFFFQANGNPALATLASSDFPVCFVTGTRIRTARGEVAVEDLLEGDLAVTAAGRLRPIAWIGHRDIDDGGKVLSHDQQPIRIRAGAFGPGIPTRDLRLSPGHPVLVGAGTDGEGGHLVPVMCLINGTTIVRDATATAVTYWHVELDSHDILLAEGLPAESYLDWGDRPFFTEGSGHALHNPDFVVPGLSGRCRPVMTEGAVVEAERLRLDAVFAAELAGHSAWSGTGAWLTA